MSPRARYSLVALMLVVAAVCIRLGIWQLDRLQQRRAANAATAQALALPEVEATGGGEGLAGRRVRVSGTYDPAREQVLRGQVVREVPGVRLVTPLRPTRGDTVFLVDRGYVPAPDAATVDADTLAEPGPVTVRGIAMPLYSAPDSGRPLAHRGYTTWRRLDLAALRQRLPYPVATVVIRQLPDSSLRSFPRRTELPPLDDGPHMSYALQWFAFATIALVMAGIAIRSKK